MGTCHHFAQETNLVHITISAAVDTKNHNMQGMELNYVIGSPFLSAINLIKNFHGPALKFLVMLLMTLLLNAWCTVPKLVATIVLRFIQQNSTTLLVKGEVSEGCLFLNSKNC